MRVGSNLLYLTALLKQDLVVFAQCDTKNNGGYIFKAVDPFLAFTSLTANVKHAAVTS
jgi:hypothetical protein